MLRVVLFALLAAAVAEACLPPPSCSWSCDDPQCNAICKPVVSTYPTYNATDCPDGCIIVDLEDPPEGQCVSESCPMIGHSASFSTAPRCSSCHDLYSITRLGAEWCCRAPDDCPKPTCVLECTSPACEGLDCPEYQAPYSTTAVDKWQTLAIVFIVLTIVSGTALSVVILMK